MTHGNSDFIDTGKYWYAEPAEALDTENEPLLSENSYNKTKQMH